MNTVIQYILKLQGLFILVSLLLNFCIAEAFSQNTNANEESEVFTNVEKMPEYPGGDKELLKYFLTSIIYPEEAKAKQIEGVVVIGFVVAKDGSVKDVKLIKDIGGGCGEEAVRLGKLMTKWSPGLRGGKPVDVAYKFAVRFSLENSSKKNNYISTYKQTSYKFENTYNFSVGFTGGLHSPYGFGGEFSYMLGKNMDLNIGFGLGGSGLKTGIGARFFLANKEVSPYVGVNLIHATGLRGIRISSDNTGETIYNTLSDQALHIKGGIKVNTFYNQYFYLSGGYALTNNGYEAEYVSGFYNQQRQKLMNLAAVGGVQVTITYIIGFNTAKQNSWEGDSWGK